MAARYDYTRVLVSNFTECFRFYRDALGFQPSFGTEDDTYADFAVGTTNISLFDRAEMSEALGTSDLPIDARAQDRVCLVFGVDDLDAEHRRLIALGIRFVVGITEHPDWGIKTLHFRDPDGNLIELNQPLS